jgi:hypothetical protein
MDGAMVSGSHTIVLVKSAESVRTPGTGGIGVTNDFFEELRDKNGGYTVLLSDCIVLEKAITNSMVAFLSAAGNRG